MLRTLNSWIIVKRLGVVDRYQVTFWQLNFGFQIQPTIIPRQVAGGVKNGLLTTTLGAKPAEVELFFLFSILFCVFLFGCMHKLLGVISNNSINFELLETLSTYMLNF